MSDQPGHPQFSTLSLVSAPADGAQAQADEPGRNGLALPTLPPRFWEARPALKHIRTAAHARRGSADVVFYTVLTRLAAFVSPYIVAETEIGDSEASLNFFAALVGQSGTGKSIGAKIAKKLLPTPTHLDCKTNSIGSGEGIAEAYMGDAVIETDPRGRQKTERRQVRENALLNVDEGQALTKLESRAGTTLGPTLRSAWTGEDLGQENASKETTRRVTRYSLGMLIGFQVTTALPTLNDHETGMAQRFIWSTLQDPTMPDRKPEWPGPLSFDFPVLQATELTPIKFAPSILDELDAGQLQRGRYGIEKGKEHDSHKPLMMVKVASLLALLEGRLIVTEEDWALARIVWGTSCAVRNALLRYGRSQSAAQRAEADKQHVTRQVKAARAVSAATIGDQAKAVQVARLIVKYATETPKLLTKSAANRNLPSRDRKHLEVGIAYAESQNWIETDGPVLRLGTSRPGS